MIPLGWEFNGFSALGVGVECFECKLRGFIVFLFCFNCFVVFCLMFVLLFLFYIFTYCSTITLHYCLRNLTNLKEHLHPISCLRNASVWVRALGISYIRSWFKKSLGRSRLSRNFLFSKYNFQTKTKVNGHTSAQIAPIWAFKTES